MKVYLLLFFLMVTFTVNAETPTLPSEPVQEKQLEPPPFPGETVPVDDSHNESSFGMQLLNMLTTLGLLIAVVLISSWVLKRMMRTRIQQANQTSRIKILEQRALTTKTVVSLIEIRGHEIAIAESANGVTLLGRFADNPEDEKEEVPDITRKGIL